MENRFENIDRIIVDYLNNSISESDTETLLAWRKSSNNNEEEFNEMEYLWKKSQNLKVFDQIDIKQDWISVKSKIQQPKKIAFEVEKDSKNQIILNTRKIAAVLAPLLIISASLFLYLKVPGFGTLTAYKTDNEVKEFVLPDKSTVVLNKFSKIVFRNDIADDDIRDLNLEGEGFFEVTHNETPFKVHVKNAVVQVMGTEFNVNQHKDNIVVSVVSGKVKVEAFNHAVELEKGERAIVKQGRLKEESLNSVNDLFWKSGELKFEQATLKEICNQLKQSFVEIKALDFKCKEDNTKLTTSFNNQSLKEIIEELKLHFNKKIVFDGKTLTISD